MLTGFIRLNGRTVGVVANQPMEEEGVVDGDGCAKAARFIGFCDCFNVPILTLVDTSGLAQGALAENNGLLRRGGALIHAYASATVPKVAVVCGRAHGMGVAIMGSRALGMDVVYAWPNAEISVAPPDTAVNILYANEIAAAQDPQAARSDIVQRYRLMDSNPLEAARGGHVDDIIEPAATRTYVAAAFEMLLGKREEHAAKKHGNMPL
jgi:acetyl-CoA carboxylase carboxyltransferase component